MGQFDKNAIKSCIKGYCFPQLNKEERIKGYQGQEVQWNDDLDKAKTTHKSYQVVIDNRTFKLFNDYLTDCKKRGIKVILVYSPEDMEGQRFIKNKKDITKAYTEIEINHNIPFMIFLMTKWHLISQIFTMSRI